MNGNVEIPEHFHLLKKEGISSLSDVLVYDYWWRFIRNFKIRSADQFRSFGYEDVVPEVLLKIIKAQKGIPYSVLKTGAISKTLMYKSFLANKAMLR